MIRFALPLLPILLSASVSFGQLNRVANTSLNLPADLPSGNYNTTNAFPALSFTDPVVIVTPPGETNRLFVVEKVGRIAVIPDLSNPTKETFLDITAKTRPGGEEGLLGLAFHPNYHSAGKPGFGDFFVYYQTDVSSNRHWRLSRFSVDPSDPDRALAASEVPMITQRDQAGNHNGGDLAFGDDGYLYISVGDEGGANDTLDNGQHIDKDFFAAIFRIDVDSLAGNLTPNSHAAVHANTYRVPADNAFVGANSFNGQTVTPGNVRTEIWATGMRNPWRMSFDRPTGRLFVADVGQVSREEINILSPSVFAGNAGIPNYGWSYREGFADFNNGPGGATPPPGFSHINPIHDYPRSQGQSVTGGIVYRGANYPELTGDYLFADYVSGRVWAMDDPGGANQNVTELFNDNNIACFGLNPQTGDILVGDLGSNSVKRIVRTPGGGAQPPTLLSQTGAFSNLTNLTPHAGIVPYAINAPFWSDRAEKIRWFSIPEVTDTMIWDEDNAWTFPSGQVWIKHFDLDLNPDNPGTNVRRVETRFLVKTGDDIYGITYRWNDSQTDAELVADAGLSEDFDVTQGGSTVVQSWNYPSRADCRTCHNPTAGFALGFNTRQLNSEFTHGAVLENQIASLENAGYFSNDPPAPAGLPRFFAVDDEAAPLGARARSYLAVNCVQCHQPGGSALGSWSARPEITLEESGILDGELSNNDGDPFNRVMVPGSPTHSMLVKRLDAVGGPSGLQAMPPLSTNVKNQEGIDLLSEWINSKKKILFVRGGDRSGGFLEGTNDTQRTEHLADINNTTTGGGNHGWGELAATLRDEGYLVEQITEGSEIQSGPAEGIHIDFESLNLEQYSTIVFGSNNAVYDTAAIDAVDSWIRSGGSALFISDANFGGDWADAPNSDQQFLDRFGLIMNQDQGTYAKTRSDGEFLSPNHPIFDGVDEFHGEGVSPISLGSTPGDVSASVLAGAEGSVRRNVPPFGNRNQGSSTAAVTDDGALLVASAGSGRIAGHFDRNTFFNQGGVGSDITRFDNRQYAINLFDWLCRESSASPPTGLTATQGDFTDRVDLTWNAYPGATGFTLYRNTIDAFGGASIVTTTISTSYSDSTVSSGLDYFYWISATVDGNETAESASVSGFSSPVPPTGLSASDAAFDDRVDLSWSSVAGSSSYRVYRATTDSSVEASFLKTSTEDTNSDAAPDTRQYFYFVSAVVNGRESALSSSDSGSRRFPVVTDLEGSVRTIATHVELSWSPNSDADFYRVYRNTTDSFGSATLLNSPALNAFSDTTAEPDVDYFYWVEAVNSFGSSAVSASTVGARLAEPPQPDLLIGKSASTLRGNGIYYTTSGQTLRVQKSRRRPVKAFAALQNDGGLIEQIRVAGTRKNRFFRIEYRRTSPGNSNITGAVSSGRYLSAALTANGQEVYRITARPTSKLKRISSRKTRIIRVRGFSQSDPLRRDQVRFDAKSRR